METVPDDEDRTMSDWAFELAQKVVSSRKARHRLEDSKGKSCYRKKPTRQEIEIAVLAQALREARAKGLEEAAQFVEIEAKEFSLFMQTAAAIRKLKEQP